MRFTLGGEDDHSNCPTQSFSIFEREAVNDIIIDRRQCEAQTSSGIQGSGPFEIIIHSEKKTYIDPSSIRVNASFRIKKKDATSKEIGNVPDIPTSNIPVVAPINQLSKSIFKSVEVELENTPISLNASETYAVESYISTMLSYDKSAVNRSLRCSYFEKDTPGNYDTLASNTGAQKRAKWIEGSPLITVCDDIKTELTTATRYIVPGVSIKFRFIVDKPSVFLITKSDHKDEYFIEFNDISLTYDRVLIKEAMHSKLENELLVKPARYIVSRNEIRSKAFAAGLTSLQWNNAYQGTLPDAVGIFMNSLSAADGHPNKNIFNFQNFGMTDCNLWVNSRKVTAKDLMYNYSGKKDCIRGFRHFWDNICDCPGLNGSMVEYEDFLDGFCCNIFDLTGDKTALVNSHFQSEGTVSLDIKLKEATAEPVNMYFIAIYKEEFYIYGPNENRRVSFTKPKKI